MADEALTAVGSFLGRGAQSFLNYRKLDLAERQAERQNRMAKAKADEEAAAKLADEEAGKRLNEIRSKLNNIRSQAGIYQTDELGNTVIREDVFNDHIAPLLEEAASIHTKGHNGTDWADFYYKVNIAHRLPAQKKPQTGSRDTDLERYITSGRAAETAKRKGVELSPEEDFALRQKLTEEFKSSGEDTQRRKDFMFLVQQQGIDPERAIEMIYGRRGGSNLERLKKLMEGLGKKPGATQEKKKTGGIVNRVKGFLGMPTQTQPEPQNDTVAVDVDSLNRAPVPQDLGDVPGGINIYTPADGAEDDPEFQYYEDALDWAKERFKDSPDSLQRVKSGLGRMPGLKRRPK